MWNFSFPPDVGRVAVVVRQLEEIVGAALLVGEGALHPRLQHVLRDLVAAVHALQVLLAATLLCGGRGRRGQGSEVGGQGLPANRLRPGCWMR